MAEGVSVWPTPPRTEYPDANNAPITTQGAKVDQSKYIKDAIRADFVQTWDPLGVYQPDDRTGGGGSVIVGGRTFSSWASLSAAIGLLPNEGVELLGYYAPGDGGGGAFYWDALSSTPSDSGTVAGASFFGRWQRVVRDHVNVKWFGARGDNDQSLFAYSNSVAGGFAITQQTSDAIAIDKAIRYLRAAGGGSLLIPRGIYRTFAFLDTIDFPISIYGDGIGLSIIKSCDASPTNTNGYGCIYIQPATLSDVSVSDITLDGNATARSNPGAEFINYTLGVYGKIKGTITRVECKNSPIDCLVTSYEGSFDNSLRVSDCVFSNSYRNTVSTVAGWNQQFDNCLIEKGGQIHGGHSPRFALDIEAEGNTIQNISFSNCILRTAAAAVLGCTMSSRVSFSGCTFDASEGSVTEGYPSLAIVGVSQATFTGCTFKKMNDLLGHFSFLDPSPFGPFAKQQYVELNGCNFEGVGIFGNGADMRINNCTMLNSGRPCIFDGPGVQNLTIRGLTLINVVDADNFGAGAVSSIIITTGFEGFADIDGMTCRIEPDMLPADAGLKANLSNSLACGVYVSPSSPATIKLANVHVSGYFRKYPAAFGFSPSFKFADWNSPSPAPSDTSGQTCGPGGRYFKNCTQYGDSL